MNQTPITKMPKSPFFDGGRGQASGPPEPSGAGKLRGNQPNVLMGGVPRQYTSKQTYGQQARSPQFGHAINHFFAQVMANDATRVIAEDLIGFGVLRTIFDLTRGFFYSEDADKGFFRAVADNVATYFDKDQSNEGLFNKSIARERIIREGGNLFASNFLGGLVIAILALVANKFGRGNVATQYASLETLEVFKHLAGSVKDKAGFVKAVSGYIADNHPEKAAQVESRLQQLGKAMSSETRLAHQAQLQGLVAEASDAQSQKIKHILSSAKTEKAINKAANQIEWWEKELGKGKISSIATPVERVGKAIKPMGSVVDDAAKEVARILDPKATTFDLARKLPKTKESHRFWLNGLLQNTHEFAKRVDAKVAGGQKAWSEVASSMLKRTRRFNKWAIPLAYGAAFAFTVMVPVWNKALTQKTDKTKSYPGVKGLKELEPLDDKEQGWAKRLFPYVTEELKQGNIWPLVSGILPLPLVFGVINNSALNNGDMKNVVNNPFKKGFVRRAFRMFQFRKGFPFTTVQQVAALCAAVMSARMFTAREKTEARERLVDTYAGWALWIAIVPNLMRNIAKRIDKARGTVMTKHLPNGQQVMRHGSEISRFFDKKTVNKTMKVLKPLQNWTFGIMVALMGVVEPLIAIKWTEAQIRKDQKKAHKNELPIADELSSAKPIPPTGALPLNNRTAVGQLPNSSPWALPPVNDPMMHISTVNQPLWQPQQAIIPDKAVNQ